MNADESTSNLSDTSDYRDTQLYHLLGLSIPPLARMEAELKTISPELVSDLIRAEPDTVFLLDYYFRLMDPSIAARILGHADFHTAAALDLFNCQMIRYYRQNLDSEKHDAAYASLTESYWRVVPKEKLTELFRNLLTTGKSNHAAALMVLQNMDMDNLIYLQQKPEFRSEAMLEFFKELGGDIKKLIVDNVNIYDFVYRLAADLNDNDYLAFLEEFTLFMIQIRIARSMTDEAHALQNNQGKISLSDLVQLLQHIPDNSREMTLQLMQQENLIQAGTVQGLLDALRQTPDS